MRALVVVGWLAVIAACGPSIDGDDEGGPCRGGACGYVTGTVWAPGMTPGLVPAGEEIAIHGAVAWLSETRPAAIPREVYCEPCVEATGNAGTSDHRGAFTIGPVFPGRYWLVIQKGQFRVEREIEVAGGTLVLGDADTTLPSVHDPGNGLSLPRIAMAVGEYDPLEEILGKMGLGKVGAHGEYTSTLGEIDLYSNGGSVPADSPALGTLSQLVGDAALLRSYHIVFIPCAAGSNTAALRDPAALANLRDFVAAGGKLYVTDWSGEWFDNVFPAQVTLGDPGTDTPAAAYDAALDRWNPDLFGHADGVQYNAPDGEAVDPDLRAWLDGQVGPLDPASSGVGPIAGGDFDVYDNWNWIAALTPVVVGRDADGVEIVDEPRTWVAGSGAPAAGPGKRPLTVTFQPAGCGRVLFSTYHTTPGSHAGLLPQERVLLYLIMEIGVCNDNPPID